jgi:tetratricopeptide (TPR) repeat protein
MNNNRRTHTLLNLITDFEALIERGEVGFFDRKEFINLINYYQEEQLLDKAIEVADFALEQYKYINEFYLLKGALLLQKNSPKLAIEFIEHAERISPYDSDVRILKAKALSMLGHTEDAREIIADLGTIADKKNIVEIGLCESYIFEREGDYENMYLKLKDVLALSPENEEALEKINYASSFSRKYEENIEFHNRLLDINAYNYLAWYNLGQSYANLGEYEEAIDCLEYSFLIKKDFESGYLDCADMCLQLNRFDQSIEIFKEYLDAFDKDSYVLVNLVSSLIAMDRIDEAKEYALDAVKVDPYSDEAFYLLADIYKREENWESALNAYFKAIEIEDNREEYFDGLAKMYDKLKESAKAEKYFKKVMELEPSEEEYYIDFIRFLILQKKYSSALKIIRLSEKNVYSVDILYMKIICLLQVNKKSRALALMDIVLEENYEKHEILLEFMPEMLKDETLSGLLNYHKK